jgi:hypothetical protein
MPSPYFSRAATIAEKSRFHEERPGVEADREVIFLTSARANLDAPRYPNRQRYKMNWII